MPKPDEQARRDEQSSGTWRRRSRAITDSTTPMTTPPREHAAQEERPGPARLVPRATGAASGTTSGAEHEQLERRAVEDQRRTPAAVIEHHDLVDHRELEVRVRIVERERAQFSTSSTMNQLASTRTSDAPAVVPGAADAMPSMPASESDPRALARARASRGRTPAPRGRRTSPRARAPMPSNAEPVSSAAVAVKKRPSAKR